MHTTTSFAAHKESDGRMDGTARYQRRKKMRRRWMIMMGGVATSTLLGGSEALQAPRGLFGRSRSSMSTTRRHMVLTTPEAIFEQASTQKLLDDLIDESVRTSARRPIMMQFDPSSGWIWKRWKGTIFSETWDSCVTRMIYACAVLLLYRTYPGIKEYLKGINILWQQLLSVTTFTLTFFLNTSFGLWRKCYELSRRLQGRLHDLDMTLAAHAARRPASKPNEPTTYTKGSRQILDLVSRYVRLFNLLTYASFTRSHRPLLTPRGLRRLVERGLMTQEEREVLVAADIPATQRHNAVLLWIIRVFVEGREAGHFHGGAGFEEQFLEKVHVTRAQYGAIGDELQGRMVLAYAHIVQVLVDLVLWMYPFMAVSSGMSEVLCVLGTGLLTVSYQGLCDLAKQFLDPYDNESYGKGEDPLVVDTLIAETNAGSIRWVNGLEEMPISSQNIKDGDLSKFILPVRGYSVDELEQMERDKQEMEREMQELREREEASRRRAEELEQLIQNSSEAMVQFRMNETSNVVADAVSSGDIIVTAAKGNVRTQLPGAIATTNLSVSRDLSQFITDAFALDGAIPQALVPQGTALANITLPEQGVPEAAPSIDKKEKKAKKAKGKELVVTGAKTEGGEKQGNEVRSVGTKAKSSKTLVEEVGVEQQIETKEESVGANGEGMISAQRIQDAETSEIVDTKQTIDSQSAEIGDLSSTSGPDDTGSKDTDKFPVLEKSKLPPPPQSLDLPPETLDEMNGLAMGASADGSELEPLPREPTESPISTKEDLESGVVSQSLVDKVFELNSEETGETTGHILTGEESLENDEESDASLDSDELTFEDYERRVEEILRAEQEELLETQAILNAPPGANSLDVPEKKDSSLLSNVTEPSDELSVADNPLANATDLEPTPSEHTSETEEELVPAEDILRVEDSQVLDGNVIDSKSEETGEESKPILADEEGSSEDEDSAESDASPTSDEYTFEDYERRVEEILRVEQEELLETEAILNAPPGANSLDVPAKEEPDSVLTNSTVPSDDDLAILEMDIPMDIPTNATDMDPPMSVGVKDIPDFPKDIESANANADGTDGASLSEVQPYEQTNEETLERRDEK